MIYPASTLLLASLVVNAALVFGAPIRTSPSSSNVARAADDDPVLLERSKIVPVLNRMRSVDPDPSESRSIHQAREIAPENAIRNTAPSDEVDARDPLPEIERIVRRYPRRSLYERHEARSPPSSPPVARSPSSETESPPVERSVERRFFRRSLFERHQPRAEAPTPLEAREAKPLEDPPARRYPRKILAEYYIEKRTPEPAPAPPTVPEPLVAREPQPEPEQTTNRMVRRFARRGMAEQVEARQDAADPVPPVVPPAAEPSASAPASSSVVLNAAAPTTTASVSASASPSASASSAIPTTTLVAASTNPVVEILGANKAANFVNTGTLPNNGLPVEIDREHETTVYHQKTTEHISQCNGEVKANPGVSSAIPSSTAIPSGTSAPVASPTASGASGTVPSASVSAIPSAVPGVPLVPAQGNGGDTPVAEPSKTDPVAPSASQVVDPQLNPAPTEAAAVPPAAANVAPVRRDDEVADAIILRGRALGYSGPAWASYKRSTMN